MDFAAYLSPLLSRICEYAAFHKSGVEIPYDTLLSEIQTHLTELERQCSLNPQLHMQYRKVERAVIFFIDYTIKEGGFSYSQHYTELARSFNELSGDEKFFDLLNEALERKEDPEIFKVYYLMLGLGFDGAFKRERPQVLELMSRLRKELAISFDPRSQPLCPDLKEPVLQFNERQRPWWWWLFSKQGLITLVCFTVLALVLNVAAFNWSVSEFVDAIEKAATSARPYQ